MPDATSNPATILSLLQVTVPPATPLTVTSEMKILKMLEIVSREPSVQALDMAADLVPAGTPATLHGLSVLLSNIAKANPDLPKSAHDKLNEFLTNLKNTQDAQLTYGTFLGICQTWMSDTSRRHAHKTHRTSHKSE
jgi:hypothetical protein